MLLGYVLVSCQYVGWVVIYFEEVEGLLTLLECLVFQTVQVD